MLATRPANKQVISARSPRLEAFHSRRSRSCEPKAQACSFEYFHDSCFAATLPCPYLTVSTFSEDLPIAFPGTSEFSECPSITIHGTSDFRRRFPKSSPPILDFRREGDGQRLEIQNGTKGDGPVEEVECLLVGIGDDFRSEVDPLGNQLARREAVVVVKVVILMTKAEDDTEAGDPQGAEAGKG